MARTIALFGAGGGMGQAVARRFGREGYRVALVARRREPLDELVATLAAEGIEAAGFTVDLRRTGEVPALVAEIRKRFGRIDVLNYAPFTPAALTTAADLDAAELREWANLYLLTPVELVNQVLPEMLERGNGGILFVYGSSVIIPAAGVSGPVPLMAAARNYILTLHQEVAGRGVYAGGLAVRALIARSQTDQAVQGGELKLNMELPTVEPDELADLEWRLMRTRDRADVLYPAPPRDGA
ncbi:SDR family NAD(P)-dependent oxidoreductase [Streptomyces sp. NPDC002018]|uniref:SDR family NAD(P)-dependent oxidoreductase n=1 Tax=Streptomyces sp. NPDC002018 TaxID=3364629 RepID=UPI003676ADA1